MSGNTRKRYAFTIYHKACGKTFVREAELLDPTVTMQELCRQGCECGLGGELEIVEITQIGPKKEVSGKAS